MSTTAACSFRSSQLFLLGLLPSIFSILIVIWILIKSIKQLKESKEIFLQIKILFYIATISSIFVILLLALSALFTCPFITFALYLFTSPFYFLLQLSVAGTLFTRVYLTFKDSIFEISKCQKYTLLILYIAALIIIISWYISFDRYYQFNNVSAVLVIISGTSCSVYGMYLFSRKMYQLIQMRQSSIHKQMDEQDVKEIKVNEQQKQLLYATSKYISLLSLAIVTTTMTWIISGPLMEYLRRNEEVLGEGGTEIYWQMVFCIISLDCMTNVICLYLQYKFNQEYYDKYCACFGKCWGFILITKTEMAMRKKLAESIKNNKIHVAATSDDCDEEMDEIRKDPENEKL